MSIKISQYFKFNIVLIIFTKYSVLKHLNTLISEKGLGFEHITVHYGRRDFLGEKMHEIFIYIANNGLLMKDLRMIFFLIIIKSISKHKY